MAPSTTPVLPSSLSTSFSDHVTSKRDPGLTRTRVGIAGQLKGTQILVRRLIVDVDDIGAAVRSSDPETS